MSSDKPDLEKLYENLQESIQKAEHNECLVISNKILSSFPNETEAIQTKIVSLINIGKTDEIVTFLKDKKLIDEYLFEYAYALYDQRRYKESMDVLLSHKRNEEQEILLAQNYYKIGEYQKSYEIYKKNVEQLIEKEELESETDLFLNLLAVYSIGNIQDDEFLKKLQKYLSGWETHYNFLIIYLIKRDINSIFMLLNKINEEFPELEEEQNEMKNTHLYYYIVQNILEGFEVNKQSGIAKEFDSFFNKSIKDPKKKEYIKMMPYFYTNMLYYNKNKNTNSEILKKLESFLKNKDLNLSIPEIRLITKNKINFYIRGNKLKEASELLDTIKDDEEYNLYNVIINFKKCTKDDQKKKIIEDFRKEIKSLKKPEYELLIMQLSLSSLNTLISIEDLHKDLLSFIKNNKEFCLNIHFINFFIGFYMLKKRLDLLKEFINEFNNIELLKKIVVNPLEFKNLLLKFAEIFYKIEDYDTSVKYYQTYLDNYEDKDDEVKILMLQSLANVDLDKAESIRRKIDDTETDLSNENITNLINELFGRFKKTDKQEKKKKKKKKKILYPKNYDPQHPGPMPDPERWLPKMQKKRYRLKNKMAHQGSVEDNANLNKTKKN